MNAMNAFKTGTFGLAKLCCPECGTESGIHFGAPFLTETGGHDEKDAQLTIPVFGDSCHHQTHLIFTFHGGTVSISADQGRFASPFFSI